MNNLNLNIEYDDDNIIRNLILAYIKDTHHDMFHSKDVFKEIYNRSESQGGGGDEVNEGGSSAAAEKYRIKDRITREKQVGSPLRKIDKHSQVQQIPLPSAPEPEPPSVEPLKLKSLLEGESF